MFIRVSGGRKKSGKFVETEGTITVTTNVTGAAVEILDGTTPVATGSTLSGYTFTTDKIKYGTYVVTVKREGCKDFTQTVVLNADDAKVDAQLESVNEVKAELEKAYKVNDTQVQVNFTNKIAVPTVSNFSIEGLTITDAKITDDQKSVILTVSGMELDKTYTVKTNNIVDANGKAVADGSVDFTARKITYKADMDIIDVKTGESITEIKSDGKETAKFVVTLKDDAGNVIKDNAEVRFTTTAGNFAETKVSAQSGVATNIFTSEISATQKNARVTATVVASDNKDLINIEATRTLSMNPNVNNDNKGASLTDVMVETCDRVILYFNKPVDAKDYTVNKPGKTYKYDASKMKIQIADNAGTYETVEACEEANKTALSDKKIKIYEPMALAPVPDNPNALYAILNTDGVDDAKANYLTDNAKAIVKITDFTKTVPTTETKATNVTDIRTPSMLSVTNEGLRTIKITFSEPVQNETNGVSKDSNSAELLSKWVIDQAKLEDAKYGSGATKKATATVGKFNVDTGEDNRNVVTITLGKDDNNKQIYFKAGSHSVQGNKIGDWANITDTANNLINTQTLDFVIEADDTAPTATVKVESPEQFDLKFNTPVELSDLDNLELQYKKDNEWVKVTTSKGSKAISIRPVENTDGKEYIVELTEDWTKILKTNETKKNYYNYNFRLYIKKDVITNVLNGLKNAEIALDLNDKIMKEPDVTSAELSGVYKDDDTVVIDISEPVQIDLGNVDPKYDRILTPKKEQDPFISEPIVQFISSGDKETIQGHIVSISDHDNQITVKPDKTISTGTWRVVVRNVSDDVGNTSPTLVKNDFVVDKPIVNDDFNVLWVVGVQAGRKVPVDVDIDDDAIDLADDAHDVIYVKFNKEIKTFGGTLNAGATTNYTVNGYTLPTTTKIVSSVDKYNEKAVTKNSYSDIVAIQLTKGTLTDSSNTINISKTLESAAGDQLGNGGLKLLSKYMNNAGVFAWNFEKCDSKVIGKTEASTSDVQSFLNDGKYSTYDLRDVDITDSDDETLTIKHTSNVEFKSGTKVKELVIDTQETGVLKISGVSAEKITVNAPNADVVLNGVEVKENTSLTSHLEDVGTLEVIDILDGTLTLKNTTADVLKVTDSNAGAIEIGENTTIKNQFVIDTNGTITLNIASGVNPETALPSDAISNTKGVVDVKKACTLNVQNKGSKPITIKVDKDVNLDNMKINGIVVTGTPSIKVYTYDKKDEKYAVNDTITERVAQGAEFDKLDCKSGDPQKEESQGSKAKTTLTVKSAGTEERRIELVVKGPGNEASIVPVSLANTVTEAEGVATAIAEALKTNARINDTYNVTVDKDDKTKVVIEAKEVGKATITVEILSQTGEVSVEKKEVNSGEDAVVPAAATYGTATFEVTKGCEIAGKVTVKFTQIDDDTSKNGSVVVPVSINSSKSEIAKKIVDAINEGIKTGGAIAGYTVKAEADGNKVIITCTNESKVGSTSNVKISLPTFSITE